MCNFPLKGFPVGITAAGKTDYKIVSYGVDHVDVYTDRIKLCSVRDVVNAHSVVDYVEIPCGKCISCRLKYSRDWADRMVAESLYHAQNWFITLTYDDDHLQLSDCVNTETGEITPFATLVKKDMQDFHKRLRRRLDYVGKSSYRYYYAGEYGDQTARPHYHMIAFGLQLDDLVPYKRTKLGYTYYNSPFLQDCWRKGYVVVGQVTWQTCAYVARYVMKKRKGKDADIYDQIGMQPEYCDMSRRPGIAYQWYQDHQTDLIELDSVVCGDRKLHSQRYFNKLLEIDCPEQYAVLSAKRKKLAEEQKILKLRQTDLDYLSLCKVNEYALEHKIKALVRKEI